MRPIQKWPVDMEEIDMDKQQPLLSIGIIFKNEIRCLERCLESLQPLRKAIACELVMADTGSDDGSREIAEKYADILIDFPWINDFAAARNAVIDRCSGKWHMTVDCDEWLDADINRLVWFLSGEWGYDFASLIVRNYKSLDLEKSGMFSDFAACRIMRMSTGTRYEGAIHEHWNYIPDGVMNILMLSDTILHHDGYVFTDPEFSRKKIERNMKLLKAELAEDPNSLLLLMQCIESDANTSLDYMDYVYRAVEGVRSHSPQWNIFGPSILRHAVLAASTNNLPELEEWISLAEEYFPKSIFTRIDVAYLALGHCWNVENYEECIRWGDIYMQALSEYQRKDFDRSDIISSPVSMSSPYWQQNARIYLSAACLFSHMPERSHSLLSGLDATLMDIAQIGNIVRGFCYLHSRSHLDTEALLLDFWESMNQPQPTAEKAEIRCAEFLRMSAGVFDQSYQENEAKEADFCRPAYTLFIPLADKCGLGAAAAVMDAPDADTITNILSAQESLNEIPAAALLYALEQGIEFPLPGHPIGIEELANIAGQLAQDTPRFYNLVLHTAENAQGKAGLAWAQSLLIAALRANSWKDEETGLSLARAFAQTEKVFLPLYYASDILCEENLFLLSPMHRFGWHCIQAFYALDAGDKMQYIHFLRSSLTACGGVKSMVKFLTEHTPEIQSPPPSEELKALAGQIRSVLSMYAPDDPAVMLLKQSDAYQQVAYLIEGAAVPVKGGLPQ